MFVSIGVPVLLILAGLFSAFCAIMEYPWFMNHRKAMAMKALLGHTLTRVFYITIGVALVVAGVLFLVVGVPQ